MPSLSDRSFTPKAWARLGVVAVGLALVVGAVYGSSHLYSSLVREPRILEQRHLDEPGLVSARSLRVVELGKKAIPTLQADIASGSPVQKRKAIELLGAIRDPAVVPALGKAMADPDLGVQLAALAALGRTGMPQAVSVVWPWTERKDDIQRLRAVVVLGLVSPPSDVDRLLAESRKVQGTERWVWSWAAGQTMRRAEAKPAQDGGRPFVSAAPIPPTIDEAAQMQADVEEVHAALEGETDLRKHARRLAELTARTFDTWDIGHQIALQVIAVAGPNAVRSMGVQAAVPTPSLKIATLPGAATIQ